MREAASLPLTFITAWEGLVDRARVQARQTVLEKKKLTLDELKKK